MPLKIQQTLTGHTDRIWTFAWNPAGTILASAGGDKTIRLWTFNSSVWHCSSVLTDTHSKSIRRVSWSPCGNFIASASFDSTVCLWGRSSFDGSWSTVMNLEGHESEVKSVAFSHSGQFLATCGRDRTVMIWEKSDGDDDEDQAQSWDCSDVKNDHSKDVKHIVWHPKFDILLSCSYDDTIKLFNKKGGDWECFETLSNHSSTVWSADFSASGEYLVTCSDDRTVRVWKNNSHHLLPDVEAHSWKCVSVIQGYHSRAIYDVSWSKPNGLIASASGDNSLAIYSRSKEDDTGSDMFVCIDKVSPAHECDVNCVAWNPKVEGLLASGGDDRCIKLWNYSGDSKGTRLNTVVDEIINSLRSASIDKEKSSPSNKISNLSFNITELSNLTNLLQSCQSLQHEINTDEEVHQLEKLCDLTITDQNIRPVELSGLKLQEGEAGLVEKFELNITDKTGQIRYNFLILIDRSFALIMPRRAIKLIVVQGELFLLEKTGDLFRITESGQCQFLLGHLFMFTDVKFLLHTNAKRNSLIISADRDEKIRISNYPNSHRIERFCFGHKHFIRRLVTIDGSKFLSIDNEDVVNLWDLKSLDSDCSKPLTPERTFKLTGPLLKRIRQTGREA